MGAGHIHNSRDSHIRALTLEGRGKCWSTGSRYNRILHYVHYIGPRQANLVLIAYASSEGSGEPAHPRSLARTFAARSYKQ